MMDFLIELPGEMAAFLVQQNPQAPERPSRRPQKALKKPGALDESARLSGFLFFYALRTGRLAPSRKNSGIRSMGASTSTTLPPGYSTSSQASRHSAPAGR